MFLFWIFSHFFSLPLIGHLHLLSTKQSNKLHSGLKVKPSWTTLKAILGGLIQPNNCDNSNWVVNRPIRGFWTRVAPHLQKPSFSPYLWQVFIFRRSLGRYTRHGCLGSPWFGCTAQVCSWSLVFDFFTINIYLSDILILRFLVIFRSTYHSTVECTAQVCCWCCSGTTGVALGVGSVEISKICTPWQW